MRNKKRMLAAGLISVTLLSAVTGCGSTSQNVQDTKGIQGTTGAAGGTVPGAQETVLQVMQTLHQARHHRTTAAQQTIMHRITAVEQERHKTAATQQTIQHRQETTTAVGHHRQACHNTRQQVLPQW